MVFTRQRRKNTKVASAVFHVSDLESLVRTLLILRIEKCFLPWGELGNLFNYQLMEGASENVTIGGEEADKG